MLLDINSRSALAVALPFVGSFGGAMIQRRNNNWYKTLRKPWFTPPPVAFPIVWSGLYASMGYASYLVWRDGQGTDEAKLALTLYGVKMAVNWMFTPVFFGAKKLGLAFADVVTLWGLVAATGISFYKINPAAGMLFIPYQAWCTLASALAYCIWRDNGSPADKEE